MELSQPVSGTLRVTIEGAITGRRFEEKLEIGFHLDYLEKKMSAAVNAAVASAVDELRRQYGVEVRSRR